ncbi:MAG: hypothetical protein ACFB2X_07760 [Rivularia sp. (in: cyanobacteria)]
MRKVGGVDFLPPQTKHRQISWKVGDRSVDGKRHDVEQSSPPRVSVYCLRLGVSQILPFPTRVLVE